MSNWENSMKKIIVGLMLLVTCGLASAHGYYRNGYWVAPAAIGGVIGYELARPRYYYPPYVTYPAPAPQIVYTQPPTYTMPPPAGYHYAYVTDPICGCPKIALLPD